MEQATKEVRCTGPYRGRPCRALLAFVTGEHFRLEIKCNRCHYTNIYTRATMPPQVPQRQPRPIYLSRP